MKAKAADRMNRTALFAILLLLPCVALGWLPAGAAEPKRGGTLTFGVEVPIRGFEPIEARYIIRGGRTVIDLIEDPLFLPGEDGELIPCLGLKAEQSDDGKVWTITLREGVKFHDGTPFNADAVVTHWQRLLDPENRFFSAAWLSPVKGVEKVDDFTVRFTLAHPWLPFTSWLAGRGGFVSHIPSPTAVAAGTQNDAPVGTGPFVFKEWKRGDRLVVERNPDYWRKGLPYLDRVVVRMLPDHQTRFAALKAGELDVTMMDMGTQIHKAQQDPELVVMETEANGAEIIILNTSKPPLDDVRVRRAIAHASNQAMHIKLVYDDTKPFIEHPFGKSLTCEDLEYPAYDPQKARELLAEYGQPVSLQYLHTNTARGRKTAEVVRQNMKAAGIEVEVVGAEPTSINRSVFTGDYQASPWWVLDSEYVSVYLGQVLRSKSKRNVTHYANPEMDELLETINRTVDPVERDRLRCSIARLINRDVPFYYRGGFHFYILAQPDVKGVMGAHDGAPRLRYAWLDR